MSVLVPACVYSGFSIRKRVISVLSRIQPHCGSSLGGMQDRGHDQMKQMWSHPCPVCLPLNTWPLPWTLISVAPSCLPRFSFPSAAGPAEVADVRSAASSRAEFPSSRGTSCAMSHDDFPPAWQLLKAGSWFCDLNLSTTTTTTVACLLICS